MAPEFDRIARIADDSLMRRCGKAALELRLVNQGFS